MKLWIAAVALCSSSAAAWGQEWLPIDARSRSLGGAGTAFADGRSDSSYWNPAALSVGAEKPFDFSTGSAFGLNFFVDAYASPNVLSTVTEVLDQYSTFDFQNAQNNFNSGTGFSATDVQNALAIVNSLSQLNKPGEGVILGTGLSMDLRVGPLGFFVRGLAQSAADPILDLSGAVFSTNAAGFFNQLNTVGAGTPTSPGGINLSNQLQAAGLTAQNANNLAFQAEQAGAPVSNPQFVNSMVTLAQNTANGQTTPLYDSGSGYIIRAVGQVEAGVGLGIPVLPTLLDVGVSFKEVISVTTWSLSTYAFQDSGTDVSGTIRDQLLKDNRKTSTNFNMDLGARSMPLEWLTLALAARNIIPMDLEFTGLSGKIHMDPQVRLGALVQPLSWLKLGTDVDLLETESPVLPDYKIRHFGAGLEFDLPIVKFRFGYDTNLARSQDKGCLTAGIGFDIYGFILDVGAQAAFSPTQIEAAAVDGSSSAKEIPVQRISVGITLGYNLPF